MRATLTRSLSLRARHGQDKRNNLPRERAAQSRPLGGPPVASTETASGACGLDNQGLLALRSQDLQGPLATVHNVVYLLQASGADANLRRQLLATLEQQARYLDDLLEAAYVGLAQPSSSNEVLNLVDLLARAVSNTYPAIRAGQHRLTVHAPLPSVPVKGDLLELEQVLSWLLNNAARYTPPGGTLQLSLTRENGEAVVQLRHAGIGIAPELLPYLTEASTWTDEEIAPEAEQPDNRLAEVRSIVEQHGGRLHTQRDAFGKGAEFVVWLPVCPAPLTALGEAPSRRTAEEEPVCCPA